MERVGKVSFSVPDIFFFGKAGRVSTGQKFTAASWAKKVYNSFDKYVCEKSSPVIWEH